MSYWASVDLGTTFSAAAVFDNGRSEAINLESSSISVPSVLFLKEDGTWLVGSSAVQRGTSQPSRVAREFKRRIGDPVPMIVGGESFSAESLTEILLSQILERITSTQGTPPDGLVITHPASWGQFRINALGQLVARVVSCPVQLLTEPVAAAIHYASSASVETGEVVCVYDLGGGTFDAALLSKTDDGFDFIGQPLGMDRFGGVDIDTTLLQMVLSGASIDPSDFDETDEAIARGLLELRRNVSEAKIILSSDTDTSVDVLVGGISTNVRVDRAEFEKAIRPRIEQSVDVVSELLSRSGLESNQIHRVLLVGGSSRIPLVTKLLSSRLGRPVVIDTDPKGAVSLGAARSVAPAASGATGHIPPEPRQVDGQPLIVPAEAMPESLPGLTPTQEVWVAPIAEAVPPTPPAPTQPPSAPTPPEKAPLVQPPLVQPPLGQPPLVQADPVLVHPPAQPTIANYEPAAAAPAQTYQPPLVTNPPAAGTKKGNRAKILVLALAALAVLGAGAYALFRPSDEIATQTDTSLADLGSTTTTSAPDQEPSLSTLIPEPDDGTTTSSVPLNNPGFGTALCSSPDATLVFTGAISAGFDIAVCLLPDSSIEYVGHQQDADSGIRLAACAIGTSGFIADNSGTAYRIDIGFTANDSTLKVIRPDGSLAVDDVFTEMKVESFAGLEQCPEPEAPSEAAAVVASLPTGFLPQEAASLANLVFVPNLLSDTVTVIDPISLVVVAEVATGAGPRTAVPAFGQIWVANDSDNSITVINPITLGTSTVGLIDTPWDVVSEGGLIWVSLPFSNSIVSIDPSTLIVQDSVGVGSDVWDLGAGDGFIWGALPSINSVVAVDALTATVASTIGIGDVAGTPVVFVGRVWVPRLNSNSVAVISTGSLTLEADVTVGDFPNRVLPVGNTIWVANSGSSSVSVIDATSLSLLSEVSVGPNPITPTVGLGLVWVPSLGDDFVYVINPDSLEIVDTVAGAVGPQTPLVDNGHIFVPSSGSNELIVIDRP